MRPTQESPSASSDANHARKQFLLTALDRYERPLTAYALRLTNGDMHQARDAVQHAYMQLCKQSIPVVKPKLASWLYTVCRNQIFDERKSSFRRKSSPINFDAIDQKATDPADHLEIDDFLQCLKGLFCCLKKSEKEVIELWSEGIELKAPNPAQVAGETESNQIVDLATGQVAPGGVADEVEAIKLIAGSSQRLKFGYMIPELLVENPEVIAANAISQNELRFLD